MKKIVALVLALVLALSLATVAFAADTGYVAANADSKIKLENITMKQVKDAGEKNVAVYNLVLTVNGKEIPMLGNYAVATAADYDLVFVNGEEVTYLKNTVTGYYTGEAKPVATVAKADAKCGEIWAADGVALYDYNGKMLKAADSFNLGTVLNTAIKEHAQDMIENFTFTKADWEAAVKHFLTTKAGDGAVTALQILMGKNDKEVNYLANPDKLDWAALANVLELSFNNVYEFAKQSYFGATGSDIPKVNELADIQKAVKDWTPKAAIVDLYEQLVEAIQGNFEYTLATTTYLNKYEGLELNDVEKSAPFKTNAGNVLGNLFYDAKAEVIAKVCEKLGIPDPNATSDPWYGDGTEAAAHNESLTFNIFREVAKMGTSVKALAVVDGKLVTLVNAVEDTDYGTVAHKYAVEVTDGAISKVSCETCKAEFAFVVGCEKDAVEKFGEGNFADITNTLKSSFETKFLGKHTVEFDWDSMTFTGDWAEGTGYYWNLLDKDEQAYVKALSVKHLYVSTAEVESAKTFDAGIALYAGLALMSVTGSAVVIGKKKEF